MIHGKLATRLSVKTEKLNRSALAGEHPVVRLNDDEGKPVQFRSWSGEQRFLRALDVHLEQEGRAIGGGLLRLTRS